MEAFFATPGALWAGLLLAPLLALYMLRHRPVVKRVPSVLLWKGAVQLQVASAPFARIQRSLSLLLMILMLLALVLALAGARIPGGRTRDIPTIVILDRTASMGARGATGTRLEVAKERAADVIDAAGNAKITLLGWDGTLMPLAQADIEPARAVAALDAVQPADQGATDAALAQSLRPYLESKRPQRVVLISDHSPGTVPGRLMFVPAGTSLPNAGITAASVSELGSGEADLFFGLELHGEDSRVLGIRLERMTESGGAEVVDSRSVTINKGARAPVTFRVRQPGVYRASLEVDDALAVDNQAFCRFVDAGPQPVAFVGRPPEALARLLENLPGVKLVEAATADPAQTAFIYCQKAPDQPPRLPAAYLGPACAPQGVTFGDRYEDASAARPTQSQLWRSAGAPGIYLTETHDIRTERFLLPVLEAGRGTAIGLVARDTGALADLVFGFALTREASNFPLLPAFVLLWANWFEGVRPLRESLPLGPVRVPEIVVVPALEGRGEFSFGPLKGELLPGRPGESLDFAAAGLYEFRGLAETRLPMLGVSLLDPIETDTTLAAREEYDAEAMREQLQAMGSGQELEADDFDLRPWLALAALVFFLFEWYWFRRRYPRETEAVPAASRRRGATARLTRKART